MSGYERPTEKGSSSRKVTFWATLWRAGESVHGYAKVSPPYGTEAELVGWVKRYRQPGDQIAAWKRTSSASGFNDEPLRARDEPKANPERLAALMREMSTVISAAKPVKKRDVA